MSQSDEFNLASESSNQNDEDITLLKGIISRDEHSFSSLYDKYAQLLYTLAMRIIRSVDDSEDIIHDVFIEIWNKPNAYQPTMGSFYSWIVGLTRSMSLARRHSKGIQKQHHLTAISTISFHTEILNNDSSATRLIDEKRILLSKTLTLLNDEEKQALVLAYYEGYKQSEIAVLLKLPANVIKFRIDDALSTISSDMRAKR
jgi:RNA polymerase sigma-70 factor (ECF subfamily)